jgi:cell division protein FtsL
MTIIGGARPLPGAVRSPAAVRRTGRRSAGARPAPLTRPVAVPPTRFAVTAMPRRRLSSPTRAGRRTSPIAIVLAAVLVITLVALVYLAQTIQIAATNYAVDQLVAQRDDLYRQVQTLESSVLPFGSEASVLDRAQRAGLDQLATRIQLPVR